MKRNTFIFFIACLFPVHIIVAQEPSFKFGNITARDFEPTAYAVDSNAAAVILGDIGSTTFEGNERLFFSLIFSHFRRAHILNKNGFELADVIIPLYVDKSIEEQLEGLKAVTYNLENGKVVQTKLDIKNAVFKDLLDKNHVLRKFTFPNVKAGSIIEFEYKIRSNYYFNLQSWNFQGKYPRLWSEYTVKIPHLFQYVTLVQGFKTFFINEQKKRWEKFYLSYPGTVGPTAKVVVTSDVTDSRWVMKDVAPLKEEGFTSTLDNHISRIEFQLKLYREADKEEDVMKTWPAVTKSLLEKENFGLELNFENDWLSAILPEATKGSTDPLTKTRNIYNWVKNNFTCTSFNQLYLEKSLKNIFKNKTGGVAEINLLLTAMLKKAGIAADPVLLSTRSNGYAHAVYPILSRYNYVICRIPDGDKAIYLDASDPLLGFGMLGYECYNGYARVINEEATAIELDADSLREVKSANVFITNSAEGHAIGSITVLPGAYESYAFRKAIVGTGKDNFIKELKKDFTAEIDITQSRIDSLNQFDNPLGYYLEFDWKPEQADLLYFNPMLTHRYRENPFKSAERLYPVEMPYTREESFSLQMEIPTGYEVEELPKQAVVKFNEAGDAVFEYRISAANGIIGFRSRLLINRAYFGPDEYGNLREFFAFIVKKHNEQIVFKKKANP